MRIARSGEKTAPAKAFGCHAAARMRYMMRRRFER
jgi:hypothetical protein